MLQSLFYTVFFVGLDVFIFRLLTGTITVKLSKLQVMGVMAIVLATSYFLPEKIIAWQPLYQFYGLLFLSFSLFIFDYATGAAIIRAQSNHGMWGSMPQSLQNVSVSVLDFFRYRLAYFGILATQLVNIWHSNK